MKKILMVLLLASITTSSYCFEWQHQTNEELRSDMIAFAEDFAKAEDGTRIGRILKRFVRKENRKALRAPYAWADDTRALVAKLERICPPLVQEPFLGTAIPNGNPLTRRNIMRLIDFPLHLDNLYEEAPEGDVETFEKVSERYAADARKKALGWLSAPAPAPGVLSIIKVYNHGYILRTNSKTVVVDVVWSGDKEGAGAIASAADLVLLSHPHIDHYSDNVMEAYADCGTPVVLPSDVIPGRDWEGKIIVENDVLDEPLNVSGVKIYSLRGAQNPVPNNGYYIEVDGFKVFLPGENDDHAIEERFASFPAPDLMMFPSWNGITDIMEYVRKMDGYDPYTTVYVPGHENEFIYHGVNHRESYRELFSRSDRLGAHTPYPSLLLLDIGESYDL
ncbi:MAG: MBL fold metallo-hydrolase [Bacteroidales bacterium]|nr:MBL fold metallo-hydrolase [Bacteroidales bacterium]